MGSIPASRARSPFSRPVSRPTEWRLWIRGDAPFRLPSARIERSDLSRYGALELFFGVTGTLQGVAHFAHLGGLAGGFLLMRAGQRRH